MTSATKREDLCMEFAWFEGWLCDLQAAVERAIIKANPNISSDRLAKLAAVDFVQSGKYHWVFIGRRFRFVVRDEDGMIFGIEDDLIRKDRAYGRVGEWERWDWEADPPRYRGWT